MKENTQLENKVAGLPSRPLNCSAAALVGHAFRCSDGVIRWIIHLSTDNYFSWLWLDETKNIWHDGGIIKVSETKPLLQTAEEVAAPQKGETYLQTGATGLVRERTV